MPILVSPKWPNSGEIRLGPDPWAWRSDLRPRQCTGVKRMKKAQAPTNDWYLGLVRLPQARDRKTSAGKSSTFPRCRAERSVRKFRGDVLGLDRIHNHDNFMDFGGHSLTTTRVSSRLRTEFPSVISPQFLSTSRTADEIPIVIAEHRETNQQRRVGANVDRT